MSRPSWVRRFVVATVAAVSLSLVASAGPAQAFVPPPIPPVPPVVVGGVVTAGAEAVGAGAVACAASVVCAVGVGAVVVGTGLYMTRDTWVPWVQGILPGGGDNQGVAAPGKTTLIGRIGPVVRDGRTFLQWSMYDTRNAGGFQQLFHVTTYTTCRVGSAYATISTTFSGQTIGGGTAGPYEVSCPPGGEPMSLIVTPTPGHGWSAWVGNTSTWGADNVGEAEPYASYRVTVECTDGTSTQNISVEYQGAVGGFVLPSCAARGLEANGKSVKVEAALPGSTVYQTIYETHPKAGQYTECDPVFGKACKLFIRVRGVECMPGAPECVEWPSRVREGSLDYECWWGPYKLPLVQCDALERAYRIGGAQLTKPNTDGNPDTQLDLNPDGSPKTGTGTSPGTGWDGKVSEMPDTTVPETSPNGDPSTEGGNCYPTGTAAWNPLEWVMRPVQCALVWAFVPSTQAVESITDGVKGDMLGSSVGEWWESFKSWGDAFGGTGLGQMGCRGPAVPTGFLSEVRPGHTRGAMARYIYPFDACSGAKAVAAATSHMVLSISIVFLSGWRLVRIVGRPFGYDLDLMNGGTSRT